MPNSFFSRFRKSPHTLRSQPALANQDLQRVSRHSSGLEEFSKHIAAGPGLSVLDLGPTSPTNIHYLTTLGHKIHNEDVLIAASDPSLMMRSPENGKASLNMQRFFAENLLFHGGMFDAVLFWDIADFLPEALVKPLVERIQSAMNPRGVLLGYFHTHEAGAQAPYFRYHIAGPGMLELQPVPRFRLQRVFNNRHIENLFQDFHSRKFFLARDAIREVLVTR
jgi:hypothetical protein